MMQFTEGDLSEVVRSVWDAMLGLTLLPATEAYETTPNGRYLTGCVQITGDWEGAVMIDLPEALARDAAAAMFGCETADLSDDEVLDALGEIANTKYLDRPIFAGTSATPAAYDASGAFLGDTNAVNRTVGPGVTVQVNVTGPQAFGPPGNDVFSTLAALSNDLRTNPAAITTTDLGAIDTAATRVRTALGEVGARSAQLETTKTRSDDLLLNLRDSLSKIEDIDLPKAATDLQIQQVSYQAALAATAKVIQPSLVDFLK